MENVQKKVLTNKSKGQKSECVGSQIHNFVLVSSHFIAADAIY